VATLTELHRKTAKVVRPVIDGGKTVTLTDQGQEVARIVPLKVDEPDLEKAFELIRAIGPVKLQPRK